MKHCLILFTLFYSTFLFGQWSFKTIDNGFDEPFKKAYTVTVNSGWLSMEAGEEKEVVEYPDSVMTKMLEITKFLNISENISSIPVISSDVNGWSTKTSYVLKSTDSSKNINGDFVISITDIKDGAYWRLSYDEMKKQPTYKVVTTSGTYFIGDSEYNKTGFPKSYQISIMGQMWSQSNIEKITQLEYMLDNYAIKKMVKYPMLFLHGSYFCDEVANLDVVFTVAGVDKKWQVEALKSSDNNTLYFSDELFADESFKNDFLASTKVKIRVNESYCDNEYYEFLMKGSTSSYNFVNK